MINEKLLPINNGIRSYTVGAEIVFWCYPCEFIDSFRSSNEKDNKILLSLIKCDLYTEHLVTFHSMVLSHECISCNRAMIAILEKFIGLHELGK